ncbi:MAG: lytic transglycosylase domain-containing protein [Pseudomonadales bacterium]|nr:lytic transglycosylase domain-containing protein [Pseudomonadales bacterium]
MNTKIANRKIRPYAFDWRFSSLTLILLICASFNSHGAGNSYADGPVDGELKEYLTKRLASYPAFKDRFDAEVWLVDMSGRMQPFIRDPETRLNLLRKVYHHASNFNLQPGLVLSVIEIESSFNPYAVSSAGAQGLMQVMPFWKKELGRETDNLTNIDTNLKYGTAILSHYLKREKGNITRALARYNGSLGKYRYPGKVFNAWDTRWRSSTR